MKREIEKMRRLSLLGVVMVVMLAVFASCSDENGKDEPEPEKSFISQQDLISKMLESGDAKRMELPAGMSHEDINTYQDAEPYKVWGVVGGGPADLLQSWYEGDESPLYGWNHWMHHAVAAPGGKIRVKHLTSNQASNMVLAEMHCRIDGVETTYHSLSDLPGLKITYITNREYELEFAENTTDDAITWLLCFDAGYYEKNPYIPDNYYRRYMCWKFVQLPYGEEFDTKWLTNDNFYIPTNGESCLTMMALTEEEYQKWIGNSSK